MTFLTVLEESSVSKAAARLGVSQSLYEPIASILGELRWLTYEHDFDPQLAPLELTIATNDFPLQLIFPMLLKGLHAAGIDPRLRFIPSGVPSANLSRASRCRFLITTQPALMNQGPLKGLDSASLPIKTKA